MQSVILNVLYLNFLMNFTSSPLVEETNDRSGQPEACYTVYNGEVCFTLEVPWGKGSNPFAKAPASPEDLGTRFLLYSRKNFSFPTVLDPGNLYTIANSSIVGGKEVRIISHGFRSSPEAEWLKNMIAEFLRADEENVIVVDWRKGANVIYGQAVANIRMVGVQLAHLISALVNFKGVDVSRVHLVGHSLGAHLVAFCANFLQDTYGLRIHRISALDPARPLFEDGDLSTRLDPSDAGFIDVIHTDNSPFLGFPLSLGMLTPVGHLDFYPNGGGAQPQCEDIRCQHYRASELFTESIRQSCTFIGVQCSSYQEFLKGECWGCENDTCFSMGMKAKRPVTNTTNTKYFLTTHGSSPFCGSHYRVTITSRSDSSSWEHGGEFAIIGIELKGPRDTTGEILLSQRSIFFEKGTIYRNVFLTLDVGSPISSTLTFHYPSSFLNPMSWRIRKPALYLHSVTVEQLSPKKKWTFCFSEIKLTPEVKYELVERTSCQ